MKEINKKQFQTATVNIDFTSKFKNYLFLSTHLLFCVILKELFFEYFLGELFIFVVYLGNYFSDWVFLIHNAKIIFIQKEASYYLSKIV